MAQQVGIISSTRLPAHSHEDIITGGLIETDFGAGSDGDIVIGTDTTLTRDMQYRNLSISAGFTLFPAGYKIKVKERLTIAATAVISASGAAGGAGAVGTGGAGGVVLLAGRKPTVCLPTAGGAGGNGGGAGVTDEIGGVTVDPVMINGQTLFEGRLWAGAGGGGGGGLGVGPTAGAIPLRVVAGAKGGSGGDAVTNGVNNVNLGGGGGGAGGGLIEILTNEIDNNGVIAATGGPGGAGQVHTAVTHQAGAGGGGGGGAILIFYKTLTGGGIGSLAVNGGATGATGTAGVAGTAGFSYTMKVAA